MQTKVPWKLRKYIYIGGGYIGFIVSCCLFLAAAFPFLPILKKSPLSSLPYYLVLLLSGGVVLSLTTLFFTFYKRFWYRTMIWSYEDGKLEAKYSSAIIRFDEITKIYKGIDIKGNKWLEYGSSLSRSYFPGCPDYYESCLVLEYNSTKIFILYLYHFINGPEIMEQIYSSYGDRIESEPYYNSDLKKPYKSNQTIFFK